MNNNANNRNNDPQYEARKRAYYEKKHAEEAAQAKKKKYKPYYIAVVALTLMIVICISAAIVTSVLYKGTGSVPTYTLKIGSDRSEITQTSDGELLINIDKLCNLFGLQKTGNAASPKYTSAAGDSVQFSHDSRTADIRVAGTQIPYSVKMSTPAVADSDGCMIPLDTVAELFSGIMITVDGATVKIERRQIVGTDKLEPVTVLNKSTSPISRIIYLTENMKKYDEYINPSSRDDYLILVNKENPISSDYSPSDLTKLPSNVKNGNINCDQMRLYAAKALEAMILDIEADFKADDLENKIFAQSGYRTYEYQNTLFTGYIAKEMEADHELSYEAAREKVLMYSALPDCSEHRTGLAVDLIDTRVGDLVNPFTRDYWMNWLANNAWKYGFILRYPESTDAKDYEQITGYEYESWHFRYVGRYHAERITAAGLTLEEYLEKIN